MIKKLAKNLFIIFIIFTLSLSSVPYDAIVLALKSYNSAYNLADKFWELKNNPNVVDNFLNSDFLDLLAVHKSYAAINDARMQYGTGTNSTPQTRFYTNATNSWGAANATAAGTANVGWVVSKESPTEDVTVMAAQSTTGKLDIFCRNGAAWTKDIANITVGTTAATRRFDVEFEKTSGVPMVLYSTNTATTNELAYYRKTGAGCGAGSWTGPTTLNPTVVTGIVLWVELEARQTSGTNVMAVAFSDANATAGGKLESMIWNGSWGNESPAGAAQGWSDLSIELQGTAGANAMKVFDLAFETNSGDLLIAWGTSTGANGTNGWRYATCAATLPCTWSGVLTPAGPLDDATNVAIAPDPNSDAIACIAEGNAGADLSAWLWSGTAVGATTGTSADATLLAAAAGDMHVDIDWVVSGSQRMAVGVYTETTTGYKYIYYDTVGAAWRTNTTTSFTVTGAPATAGQSIQVKTNPNNKTQLLVNFTDSASALWSKRLAYNGAAGGATTALSTWSNSDGSATKGPVSSITAQSFWFDWTKYAAANSPPTLSVSQPPSGNTNIAEGSSYNITYTLADTDNVVTAAFYYDTNNDGIGGTAISGACATAAEGTGATCSFNTSVLTPGTPYYIYGVTNDGVNPAVTAVSAGTLTVNDAPALSISQPDGVGDNVNIGNSYNITYTLSDADNAVTAAFYWDTNNDGVGGTAITGACATAAEGTNATCSWNTTGMSAGNYYIYGVVNDGVNSAVTAVSSGTITLSSGSLSVDIVDAGGTPIGSPSVAFASKNFSWTTQTSAGTLGISSQKIRLTNNTATATWTLSISATSGPTALWVSGGNNYDFNGSASAGRLQVDASGSTITPQGGCSTTGLSKGSATYFAQGTQDSVNLVTAGGTAQTNCYWDITGVALTQDIPASQVAGSYSIGMTLTAT